MANKLSWWKNAVVYQIYPLSFRDTNQDGVGDLEGIIEKLKYLNDGTEKSLGIDAIWLSPIYPSPWADFGYDVSDYCAVHPALGNLATFDALVEEAGKRGIKIIMDLVVNHTSQEHPWFQESRSSTDNPKRTWYIWQDENEEEGPPNNWPSFFGGSAWTRDARTNQYYLHKFLPEQPDLNLWNPEVQEAILASVRFWLERGVAGFRIDVADLLLEDNSFADAPVINAPVGHDVAEPIRWEKVYWRPETHEFLKKLRKLLDEYGAIGIGEVSPAHMLDFYGAEDDELQLPFNFSLIGMPWSAAPIRSAINSYESSLGNGQWPNYVLGNHDNKRLSSRIGPENARAAALMLLTLRGTIFLYYGDEIGMEDVPMNRDQLKDTPSLRFSHKESRDPARTPMQWSNEFAAGFSGAEPWLPIHENCQTLNVEAQDKDRLSLLALYRRLIHLRKKSVALSSGAYESLYVIPKTILAYRRYTTSEEYLIIINFTDKTVRPDLSEYHFSGCCVLSTHSLYNTKQPKLLQKIILRPREGKVFRIY
ncbi:MAG: alpha-amylase [Candidatus Spechtbacteria bacterium]|nr:alpha-amylase [Candidatus Spechtbacteria bacterium]